MLAEETFKVVTIDALVLRLKLNAGIGAPWRSAVVRNASVLSTRTILLHSNQQELSEHCVWTAAKNQLLCEHDSGKDEEVSNLHWARLLRRPHEVSDV